MDGGKIGGAKAWREGGEEEEEVGSKCRKGEAVRDDMRKGRQVGPVRSKAIWG